MAEPTVCDFGVLLRSVLAFDDDEFVSLLYIDADGQRHTAVWRPATAITWVATKMPNDAGCEDEPRVLAHIALFSTAAWPEEEHHIVARSLSAGELQAMQGRGERVPEVFGQHLGGHVVDVFAAVEHDRQSEVLDEPVQERDAVIPFDRLLVGVENAWQVGQIRQIDDAQLLGSLELAHNRPRVRTVGAYFCDGGIDVRGAVEHRDPSRAHPVCAGLIDRGWAELVAKTLRAQGRISTARFRGHRAGPQLVVGRPGTELARPPEEERGVEPGRPE